MRVWDKLFVFASLSLPTSFTLLTDMNRTAAKTRSSPSSPTLNPLLRTDALDDEADISMPSQPLSWDYLRRQARQLENEIELKLASLSKFGATTTARQDSGINDMNKAGQESEIDQLLNTVGKKGTRRGTNYSTIATRNHWVYGTSIG